MFGLKLRSWMENHIVRPRKKGSKSKNENRNVANSGITGSTQDNYKKIDGRGFTKRNSAVSSTTTTTATSSSKSINQTSNLSCECCNINHHGCSTAGISSPVRRCEVSPIQAHTPSRYGWQSPDHEIITSPKSEHFLYAPQRHRLETDGSIPHKDGFIEHKTFSHPQTDLSSSSVSSLSWSTGSKEPALQQNNVKHSRTVPPSESNMQNNGRSLSASSEYRTPYTAEYRENDSTNDVHYEEIRNLIRQPNTNASNNNFERQRPKSDHIPFKYERAGARYSDDDPTARYGRLLPSKINSSLANSIDSINANQIRSSSFEFLPNDNNNVPANHNNNTFGQPLFGIGQTPGTLVNRYKLRSSRFMAGGPPPNANGAAPINSLSSPESAYSTGYSTDAASPGAIYTPPEYYINMRTGTHYFPKSVNSLAIEAQRYKFGLNKIEEMSPQDPLPNSTFAGGGANSSYRRTESYDFAENDVSEPGVPDPGLFKTEIKLLEPQRPLQMNIGCHSPATPRKPIILPTLTGFESPSHRQRCRIRTNPWYSTTDTSSSGATTIGDIINQHHAPKGTLDPTFSSSKSSSSSTKKNKIDSASSSSSGAKSSCEGSASNRAEKSTHTAKPFYDSESSSSLTEVENVIKTHTPNTVGRRQTEMPVAEALDHYAQYEGGSATIFSCQDMPVSDDDATLNEMMGKFDESYIYEKETDILSSDSDPTDCRTSDLDTGLDAGDECDTDELLDIDFIDNSSIPEVGDRKGSQSNLGSCVYYQSPTRQPKSIYNLRNSVRSRASLRYHKTAVNQDFNIGGGGNQQAGGGVQRRRKRFMKTRKKSSESREITSPILSSRESRSVGGTPVCLRRNQSAVKERIQHSSPLPHRASSLVCMDTHKSNRFLSIAESEKLLLKADLEADMKYRQLIHEAESILVSMKSSVSSIPRCTPVVSPHRINPLMNKRVEMLKNGEIEPKRDLSKKQFSKLSDEVDCPTGALKRIETVRFETTSEPNSPISNRLTPRKTHLTNFINQNAPPELPPRKPYMTEGGPKRPNSPKVNGHQVPNLTESPISPRIQYQSTRLQTDFVESDSDAEHSLSVGYTSLPCQSFDPAVAGDIISQNGNTINRNFLPEVTRLTLYDDADFKNRNVPIPTIGMTALYNLLDGRYCPQSEPLKRKVYRGSSSFERLKKSFDLESEKPKQTLLAKINKLRRERQDSTIKLSGIKSSNHDLNYSVGYLDSEPVHYDDTNVASHLSKKLLIFNTIEDLKRNLENQSVELSGLNEN